MSTQCKQYKVTIFGQEYTLKSDDSLETVSNVAQLVDMHMHDISAKTGSKDISLIAVLTAIKLAHSLHVSHLESNNQAASQQVLIHKIDQTLHMLDSF
ncbi:cell division protein ZapA [Candidatus Dependentiae bacterium]|nr:MAG: cell division protein ZapA [Candidatus Dependentiae bacterium]